MIASRTWDGVPTSVPAARSFVTDILADLPPEVVETVKLLVSELATNCVVHARTGFHVAVEVQAGEVRVEVTDNSSGLPAVADPHPRNPHGRGLQFVELLATEWGTRFSAQGSKTTWFRLSVPTPPPRRR